jgi:hypothetical protein
MFVTRKIFRKDNVKMSKFIYQGLEFEPFRNLKGKEDDFERITHKTFSTCISPENWNYEEFYKTAKQNNADVDLFKCQGLIVIPSMNELFGYRCKS